MAAVPFPARRCRNCPATFTPRRVIDHHCSAKCAKEAENRELKRARRLYKALYHWRASRDNPMDLQFVCREIAGWVQEDKAAGRLPPAKHDHGRVESRWQG